LEILRQLLAVGFVFALLGLIVWKFGKSSGPLIPRKHRQISRQDYLRLTPQHSIHMVSAGGRTWMVACFPGGMSLLTDIAQGLTQTDRALAADASRIP
jgi:flagellar biogenesis protein FliO